MGCTASRRKPALAANGKQPDSNPSNSDKPSLKNSTNSLTGSKKDVKDDKKGEISESKPGSQTDISRLLTEKEGKSEEPKEPTEKKLKTLEEKSAKIPSVEPSTDGGDKRSQEKDAIGKTPSTDDKLPCATPLKDGQKLQPPKPDNGEYINFNDVLSDEFSEDEDDKKKEKKDGKKEEKKKEGKKEGKKEDKKEDKKEKEKEKEKPKEKSKEKDQKETKPTVQTAVTAPKHEKPKSKNKSARSAKEKGEKKKDEGNGVKKPDGMKMHETKDAVKKMRTGAARARQAPHEDTLYQVPHRMPEVDFTKLH